MKMAGQQQRGNRQGGHMDNSRGKQDDRKRNSMGKPDRNNEKVNDKPKQDEKREKAEKIIQNRDGGEDKDGSNKDKHEEGAGQNKAKFTGRCRLFVGNLPSDTSEEDFRKLFEPFGELSEVYVNTQRAFGFVRLDTRQNAENAKANLDGLQKKGRSLRVRFATHGAALRVKHLSPYVSNELLESAFSQFGAVERAVVIVDDRGKPTGEGIVEFARKPGAQQALNRINEGIFLLGANPRPIIVEPLEQKDEEDGLPEKFILKNQQFHKEHEQSPRFAQHGSFENEFAQKWKDLYRMEAEQRRQLARNMEEAFAKLDMEMESAHIEHQAMLLRQDYLRKQEELKRMEEEMQQRLAMRRQEEDMRRQEEDRRRQEMMIRQQQEEEMRRRQMERQQSRGGGLPDHDMFGSGGGQPRPKRDMPRDMPRGGDDMRGNMREEMRGNMRGGEMRGEMRERNAPPMQPPPAPPAGLGLDRPARGQQQRPKENGKGGMGGQGMNNPGMGNMGGGGGNMGGQPMRQSRFDQPPNQMGGGGGNGFGGNQNMGGGNMGGMGNNMGGGNMMGNQNNMGNNHQGGNMQGGRGNMGEGRGNMGEGRVNMGEGRGNMGEGRMMDRRREAQGPRGQGDDGFYENKRPRRF